MSVINRVALLITGLLASYQIVIGIDHLSERSILALTIGFGALLIAVIFLLIMGYEIMDSSVEVVFSTMIPLSLSLGLVYEHLRSNQAFYSVFVIVGFFAVVTTRLLHVNSGLAALVVAVVHGIAGIVIFILPFLLSIKGVMEPAYLLVGIGGGLIGMGGLLLSFDRLGKPVIARKRILEILPGLLLLTTICFVAGFGLA